MVMVPRDKDAVVREVVSAVGVMNGWIRLNICRSKLLALRQAPLRSVRLRLHETEPPSGQRLSSLCAIECIVCTCVHKDQQTA